MRYNTGQISELVAFFSPLSLAHLRSELDTKICIIEEMRTVFLSKKETMSVDYSHVLRKVGETVEKTHFLKILTSLRSGKGINRAASLGP